MKFITVEKDTTYDESVEYSPEAEPNPDMSMNDNELSVIIQEKYRNLRDLPLKNSDSIRCGCDDEFIAGFIVSFLFTIFSLFFLICRKDKSFRKGILIGVAIHVVMYLALGITALVHALR